MGELLNLRGAVVDGDRSSPTISNRDPHAPSRPPSPRWELIVLEGGSLGERCLNWRPAARIVSLVLALLRRLQDLCAGVAQAARMSVRPAARESDCNSAKAQEPKAHAPRLAPCHVACWLLDFVAGLSHQTSQSVGSGSVWPWSGLDARFSLRSPQVWGNSAVSAVGSKALLRFGCHATLPTL